ncbi:MAG: hypothetical protein QOE70_4955 [Chthoniobacter sp.]|jgi:cytochrome c553|nr:hypothetical protein [Chthoniobacter sp.]
MQSPLPILTGALLSALLGRAAAAPPSAEGIEFFEKKIRPVLVAECYECHNAKKAKGGLRLDYREGWKKGGDSGDAIVPGAAAKSLLIQSIRHEDPDLKMPSKAPKLDDAVIADFEHWVNMGAPDPRDQPPPEAAGKPSWAELLALRKTWWSLQPVKKPPVPEVKDRAWSEHPVDRFLLAKMQAKGLTPAAPADPRTLIRRLTFALTGLPPTPEEVAAFVAESIPDPQPSGARQTAEGSPKGEGGGLSQSAIRHATDRLLASPRFGEHWARHWMDLMRYAETHGSEGDPEIPQAWRYRDYLIRAFNADVPADQLIREHLAGDLLPQPRMNPAGFNESALGPAHFRLVEHGFQPVDTLDDQVKAVDNQIDVVSKAFQGLTISCARCHDHKFDAVSQRDYYALYGIFSSCRPAQITIDAPEVLGKNRPALERLHAQIKTALAEAWLEAAARFGQQLQAAPARAAQALATQEKVRALEQQIADLEWSARQTLDPKPGTTRPAVQAAAPIAVWNFDLDARDTLGHIPGHLEGAAEIKHGRLILDGQDALLRTDPLPVALGARTLEAWVAPANLDQRAGGVMTIESTQQHAFDSIVFAEKEPRRWLAGSNFFARTQSTGGPEETAAPGELVHLAAVYDADNRISLYRNGVPYGQGYVKGELISHAASQARVLLGLRHAGAKNGYFAGEIEEARLYDRPLSAAEVAASFQVGPRPVIPQEQVLAALTPAQREARARLSGEIERLRATTPKTEDASEAAWAAALKDADSTNPLHLWAKLGGVNDAAFPVAWQKLADALRAKLTEAQQFNRENFRPGWDLASDDYAKWFPYGSGLSKQPVRAGEFAIEPEGDRVLAGLMPAGAFTAPLSDKHNGLLTSPRFKIDSNSISVRAGGGGGAAVRVIVDHYPLPNNPIFAKAALDNDEPRWRRLDTAYRKGTSAYLEFATFDDLTRPIGEKAKAKRESPGRSFFAAAQIVFHDGNDPPKEEPLALAPLLEGAPPNSAAELAARYQQVLAEAVAAWRDDRLAEPHRALLDDLVRARVLPVTLAELEKVRPLVAEYRRLEAEIPVPQRAPGVLETLAYDAPFLPRGDHLKPEASVPRGYLEVLDPQRYRTTQSGRLELAGDIANPQNPLTARVMVNRIWHWLFGRGLVPTVDNLGRLGEKPTHPELLDFLAASFTQPRTAGTSYQPSTITYQPSLGWSFKETIRYLVSTQAFQMVSEPSAQARDLDPADEWLSHMRVRRLEAEAIRDSILADSGELKNTMFGPSVGAGTPRRSLYLEVRRTNLNPFLQVFDAPKPFTTLGRREATNVPAQSLTLLNSPFVIDQAEKWARALIREGGDSVEVRIRKMFATAFARPPTDDETASALAYVEAIAQDRKIPAEQVLAAQPVWQDFAQSLFNLKEFIYLR